jgi:hypothetical protein
MKADVLELPGRQLILDNVHMTIVVSSSSKEIMAKPGAAD